MTSRATPAYSSTVKSDVSDELINTYLLRPIAHLFVRVLYPTGVTPNHVTVASIAVGAFGAALYAFAGPAYLPAAGLCITLKDILDSADGQLARAKAMYSRFGRFLDSVGDFLVNLLVFAAIALALYRETGLTLVFAVALAAFLGISLRVSYHVFYQTSFLHLGRGYGVNRVSEEIREEDLAGEPGALRMQKLFLLLYGWQDKLMVRLDQWSMKGVPRECVEGWYGDRTALVLSGFLGIGTELFILMIFSLSRRLDLYLWMNIVGLNGMWGVCILYRRAVLARGLRQAIRSRS